MLKYANEDLLNHLNLLNHLKPNQWSTCHIIPVPKSGNLNDVNNWGRVT